MLNKKISAIILAAGFSSRMGDFKPLMTLGKTTLLEKCICLFQSAGIADIRIVVGYRSADLLPVLKKLKIRWEINENYQAGMYASVVAGVRRLEADRQAFFVMPVDIPLVQPSTIESLLTAYQVNQGAVFYPTYHRRRGHPPLISAKYIPQIIEWQGEGGLKAFLKQHEAETQEISVEDKGILVDFDTPEMFRKWENMGDMHLQV